MAYTVEQKIKGRIYLYKVESYWDKEKKQPRQRRTYIGPKRNGNSGKTKQIRSSLVSKGYGNVFLLKFLSEKLGLTKILTSLFPDNYQEILALAFYEIIGASALYLFPYWLDEHNLPGTKKMYSPDISKLCDILGRSQIQRVEFVQKWIEHLKPINGIFYDITSISSYSTNVDFIEWGYNRDKENLPQLNMGVTFCHNHSLPIYYNLYPGSIVDVTTLKNCVEYLKIYNLKDILFVLDRGFFSKANVLKMDNSKSKVSFVQPLPFSLKKVKALVKKNKRLLSDLSSAFKFNEEVLHHKQSPFEFDGNKFDAHMFFNEKSEVEQKHNFFSALFEYEEKFKGKIFRTLKEYLKYRRLNIPEKYREYFKWNKTTLQIEKNARNIKSFLCKMGSFVLMTNKQQMDKSEVLNLYRQKDQIEKMFDIFKNEMNGDRLRAHSQYNVDGRLFIKFVALIIYAEASRVMRKKRLFDKYTVKELFAELKKLKITHFEKNAPILSEISKRQKIILDAFGIQEGALHSY
ncbi:MAG: IS1634 family transposase [Deltaproteobacteria bacterium]|nr:IS1634 family transposase [Deltaproteobacteria bacterium]